jgi:hypothetical protein
MIDLARIGASFDFGLSLLFLAFGAFGLGYLVRAVFVWLFEQSRGRS